MFDTVASVLSAHHYLGPRRGRAYVDEAGVIVVGAPTSRNLPKEWAELSRWCITDRTKNAGSRQWARFVRWMRQTHPACTTIVSYSDPSVGHTGALYRACNWLWAPTWHRLQPPPTGLGSWDGKTPSAPKDRWVYPLRPDGARAGILSLERHGSVFSRFPWASYVEPVWRRGVPHGGGGNFALFQDGPWSKKVSA